jgi:hypothetical protein
MSAWKASKQHECRMLTVAVAVLAAVEVPSMRRPTLLFPAPPRRVVLIQASAGRVSPWNNSSLAVVPATLSRRLDAALPTKLLKSKT